MTLDGICRGLVHGSVGIWFCWHSHKLQDTHLMSHVVIVFVSVWRWLNLPAEAINNRQGDFVD